MTFGGLNSPNTRCGAFDIEKSHPARYTQPGRLAPILPLRQCAGDAMYCLLQDPGNQVTRTLTGAMQCSRPRLSNHCRESHATSALPSIPVAGYNDERQGRCETGQCRPSMVSVRDLELIPATNELTPPDSIQEALRMYLQPIKNDDPQLDFYTMYKRETMEYDTENMQKHNEDLNTTLIFVRLRVLANIMQR